MKRILTLCSLYFAASLSYADTCPQPPYGYVFRVAAWGNHADTTIQIRCHYYNRYDESKHQEIRTDRYYREEEMSSLPNWNSSGSRYYLCTSFNTDVNECAFSHR